VKAVSATKVSCDGGGRKRERSERRSEAAGKLEMKEDLRLECAVGL